MNCWPSWRGWVLVGWGWCGRKVICILECIGIYCACRYLLRFMKYILILALLLVCGCSCFGQGFAKVYTNPVLKGGVTTTSHLKNNGTMLFTAVFSDSLAGNSAVLTKTDSTGNVIWAKKLLPTGANQIKLNVASIVELEDESFIVKGFNPYAGIMRFRGDGILIWSKKESFDYFSVGELRSPISFSPDKRYFYTTLVKPNNPRSFSVLKIDTGGHLTASYEYSRPDADRLQVLGVMPSDSSIYIYCYLLINNPPIGSGTHGSCMVIEADLLGKPRRVRRLPDSDSTYYANFFGLGRIPSKGCFLAGPLGGGRSGFGSCSNSYSTYFFHNHLQFATRICASSAYMQPTAGGIHSYEAGNSNYGNLFFLDTSFTIRRKTLTGVGTPDFPDGYPVTAYFSELGRGKSDNDFTVGAIDVNLFNGANYFRPLIGQNAFSFAHLYYDESTCINSPGASFTTHITVDLVDDSIQYHADTLTLKDQPLEITPVELCVLDYCNLPHLDLGADLAVCDNSHTLTAPTLFPGQHQRWSTGDTSKLVNLPVPGVYTLLVYGLCGSYRDTIALSRSNSTSPTPSIHPRPLATCPLGEIVLGVQRSGDRRAPISWTVNGKATPASAEDSLYIRPTNPTNRDSVLVVRVVEGAGICTGRDTLRITLWPGYPNFLGPDILTCQPDTVLARPSFAVDPSWVWHLPGGSTSQASLLRVREAGSYAASFIAKGCLYADTLLVRGGASGQLPNVITLNGDGLNRYLIADCLPPGSLTLFNRWGKQVFSQEVYDGLWPPIDNASGVYFYSFSGQDGQRQSGWVEVVR